MTMIHIIFIYFMKDGIHQPFIVLMFRYCNNLIVRQFTQCFGFCAVIDKVDNGFIMPLHGTGTFFSISIYCMGSVIFVKKTACCAVTFTDNIPYCHYFQGCKTMHMVVMSSSLLQYI